jgi:hypothetical protein
MSVHVAGNPAVCRRTAFHVLRKPMSLKLILTKRVAWLQHRHSGGISVLSWDIPCAAFASQLSAAATNHLDCEKEVIHRMMALLLRTTRMFPFSENEP